MKLIDGTTYKFKETGEIFTLFKDYDEVRWYMYRRCTHKITKTLSIYENEMIQIIAEYYEDLI